MNLNKNYFLFYFCFISVLTAQAQGTLQDSTATKILDKVVVTGQYNPQSIKKSVYNVIVIDRAQIERQAANTLADLLNFNLNLTIIPNAQTGRSTISFFGLDANYFNILIDNIPLVSDTGLGNNIDLTQINLDDVERIEIVEGAMGVEFGANALSGVINIITKKGISNNWQINTTVQEETVNTEYAWFNKGRHIQALDIGHNITNKWFARLSFNRNDFAGFFNERKGRDYIKNDGRRGYEWLPKTQLNSSAFLNYKSDAFNLNYNFKYFDEEIKFYNQTVRPNINVQEQTSNPSATDRIFNTNRLVNNLNVFGRFKSGINYNASFSYQEQKRTLNEFNYFILSGQKSNESNETYQSSKVFYSKGSVNNSIKSKRLNFQLGYETRFIQSFDAEASGSYTGENKKRNQENYATFLSAEYNVSEAFSLRPGLRYEYNSKFKSKFTGSLSARHLLNNGFELRANLGSSYRTPTFQELYFYFVDSNHDVQGNQNLKPENGFTAFINLKKRSWFKNASMVNSLKLSYIDVDDRIDLAIVNLKPLQYQYININTYRLLALTTENMLKAKQFTFRLGATLQGISRQINDEENAKDDFLYALQLNTAVTYHLQSWDTYFTALLKYQGPEDRFVQSNFSDANGNTTYNKQTTEGYTWLDASVRKRFFKNNLDVTLGARNLLDITQVDISNSGFDGGSHSVGSNSLLLGYGRSFYLKLTYTFNF